MSGYVDPLVASFMEAVVRGEIRYEKIVHPEDRDRFREALRAHLEEGMPYSCEYRVRTSAGGWLRWHDVAECQRDAEGRPVRMLGACTDVTERRLAEEALKRSERKFRIVAENTYEWEFWVAPDGRYVYCSPSCERITGHRAEEFLADTRLLSTLVHPDDREAIVAHKRERLASGTAAPRVDRKESLYRILRPDGSIRWISHLCATLVDEEGRFLGIRGTNRDVTESIQARDALRTLNAELEERVAERTAELETAVRQMETFSYSVSHDLRAPVRAIDGFAALLERDHGGRLDESGRRRLSAVRASTRRMGQLIDDLLQFSRLGRVALKAVPVDMTRVVEEALSEAVPAADRGRVEVLVGPLPSASGDPALLRVAVQNLLANAVKFSSRRERPVVEVGFGPGPEGNCYFVRDNGAGFDPRFADKLFGVFQRLHTESEFGGTGIGLALVKQIVERHGGKVWAEGAVDGGATFRFSVGRPSASSSGSIHRLEAEPVESGPSRG